MLACCTLPVWPRDAGRCLLSLPTSIARSPILIIEHTMPDSALHSAADSTTREYRKTPAMLAVESAHGGRDIVDLLIYHIEREPRMRDVADRLGILTSTCSRWVSDLGLQNYARNVRIRRRVAARTVAA